MIMSIVAIVTTCLQTATWLNFLIRCKNMLSSGFHED